MATGLNGGIAMVRRFEIRKSLNQEVLRLYKRPEAEQPWEIAEHIDVRAGTVGTSQPCL
ncbi:hypothetical protein P606_23570 [Comamonas thiooxydans]|nr:hypothetical protein P606_23570 [Comamonas thiooxydans]